MLECERISADLDVDPEGVVEAHQCAEGAMRAPRVRLTDRELEVLRLLDTGASNREIAKTLFVTEATVKTHLVHVFEKLGADSRARAIAIARDSGLL